MTRSLAELAAPGCFAALLAGTRQKPWVVYAKPPMAGPEQVLKYLARYTHRIAIAQMAVYYSHIARQPDRIAAHKQQWIENTLADSRFSY